MLTHLNFARFSLLGFRQHDRDHAILHESANFALIDLVRDFKAAGIMAHVVLGVNRLHPLLVREVNSTLNGDHIILDGGLDAVAINARNFKRDCQCLGSLENVCHWHEIPAQALWSRSSFQPRASAGPAVRVNLTLCYLLSLP
jgi:hypothetical protein